MFFKGAAKIDVIGKATGRGNLSHRAAGYAEQILGLVQPQTRQHLSRSRSRHVLKATVKICLAESRAPDQLLYIKILAKMLHNIVHRLGYVPIAPGRCTGQAAVMK